MNQKWQLKLTKKQKRILLAGTVLFLILMGLVTLWLMPFFSRLSQPSFQQDFQQWAQQQSWRAWLALLVIQFIQVVIAFIPGEPVEVLAGFVCGPWGGLVLCLLGCVIASGFVFLLTRKFGLALIHRLFGTNKIAEFDFLKDSKKVELVVFLLFLVPGTPKDLLTYIVSASPIRLSTFLGLSTLARIPSVITSTFVGAHVGQGNWAMALIIFLFTAAAGISGILFRDRFMNFCANLSKRQKPPR